jgi:hypothetical protein
MEQALVLRIKALRVLKKVLRVLKLLRMLRVLKTKKANRARMTSTEATLNSPDQATMQTPQTTDHLRHKTLVTKALHQETQKHNQGMLIDGLGPHPTDLPLVEIGLLHLVHLQALQITPPTLLQEVRLQKKSPLSTRKPTLHPLVALLKARMTQLSPKVETHLSLRVTPPPALLAAGHLLLRATSPHKGTQGPRTLLRITTVAHLTIQSR